MSVRTVVVCEAQVPFVEGGAEYHVRTLVAPWHPEMQRLEEDAGVRFHFFRYAPLDQLYVFGYARALKADVSLRGAAWAMAPFAVMAGVAKARAVARRANASIIHAHWVIPGGVIGAGASGSIPCSSANTGPTSTWPNVTRSRDARRRGRSGELDG